MTRDLAAGAVAAWSAVGLVAARASWHRAFGIEVLDERQVDRRVYAAALALALFLAGYRLVVRGGLPARALALAAAVATGAVAHFLVTLARSRSTIEELAGGAAGGPLPAFRGGIAPAGWIALAAAIASLATAAEAVRRGLHRPESGEPRATPRKPPF